MIVLSVQSRATDGNARRDELSLKASGIPSLMVIRSRQAASMHGDLIQTDLRDLALLNLLVVQL